MPIAKPRGPTGSVRRQDRLLAAHLHDRAVPLKTIENALVLAAARRLLRPADAPPLAIVRSLAYFQPVIDEVQELKVSDDYFQHLRRALIAFPEVPPRHPPVAANVAAKNKTATPSAWDDDASASQLVTNPVPDPGYFNRTLLGYSS